MSMKCRKCTKTVYQMEMIKYDEMVWHKSCFRCSKCENRVALQAVAMMQKELFCKPCFKKMFKARGKYNDVEAEIANLRSKSGSVSSPPSLRTARKSVHDKSDDNAGELRKSPPRLSNVEFRPSISSNSQPESGNSQPRLSNDGARPSLSLKERMRAFTVEEVKSPKKKVKKKPEAKANEPAKAIEGATEVDKEGENAAPNQGTGEKSVVEGEDVEEGANNENLPTDENKAEKDKDIEDDDNDESNKIEGPRYADPTVKKYSYADLTGAGTGTEIPGDVDPHTRHLYLSEEEFVSLFQMKIQEFGQLKKWKQNALKKRLKLF